MFLDCGKAEYPSRRAWQRTVAHFTVSRTQGDRDWDKMHLLKTHTPLPLLQ